MLSYLHSAAHLWDMLVGMAGLKTSPDTHEYNVLRAHARSPLLGASWI